MKFSETSLLRVFPKFSTVTDRSIVFFRPFKPMRLKAGEFVPATKHVEPWQSFRNLLPARSGNCVPPCVIVSSPNSGNYAHWMTETLPRIFIINEQRISAPVLIPPHLNEQGYVRDLLGCYQHIHFVQFEHCKHVHMEKLYVPHPSCWGNVRSVVENANFLKSSLSIHASPSRHRRIHVSRSGRRKVCNQDELDVLLRRHGFETVDFAQMSVAEQIRTCADAKVLMGAHGAGLCNSIFMPGNSLVVEFDYPMPTRQDLYFFNLHTEIGHRHFFVRGRRTRHDLRIERNEDFLVDPRELDLLLNAILPQAPAKVQGWSARI